MSGFRAPHLSGAENLPFSCQCAAHPVVASLVGMSLIYEVVHLRMAQLIDSVASFMYYGLH